MKLIFLALLFLLLISSAQAISAKDFNFNITSTSIQSNGQTHELHEKLYGNGSKEDSTRLNHKDEFVKSDELFTTIRKGGGGGGRGGGGGGRGGGSGFGKAGAGMGGRHGHHHNAASTIVPPETHFSVPKFALYLSLALSTLFLIY